MIFSMTGYAVASRELPQGTLNLELRSVNHRFLDVQFRLPEELRAMEPALREAITGQLNRGKVECRVGLTPSAAGDLPGELNEPLLRRLAALEKAVHVLLPAAPRLTVNDALRWPGMLASQAVSADALQEACLALLRDGLGEFVAARRREGEKLQAFLLERVARMEELAEGVRPRIPGAIAAYQEKLSAKLREVLGASDEERIRQEMALYAAKIDVDEELSRLGTHLQEVRRVLGQGGATGKRLDFLMQELHREANTLGSKSVDAEVSKVSMELKVLIEQMREQVQNIE